MTQYTGPGPLGWPRPYNDSDFSTADLPVAATGQWTGPGKFGYPGAWNDSDFTTDPVTPGGYVLQEFAFSAELDGTLSPFDRIDHVLGYAADLSITVNVPVPEAAILDVDKIRAQLDRTYVIRYSLAASRILVVTSDGEIRTTWV